MNTTPHAVVRKPALAALTIAATVATPALAQAPTPAAPAPDLNASMRQHTLIGSNVKIKGTLAGSDGQPIVVQTSKGKGWRTVARTKTANGGRFVTRFAPRNLGRTKVRVLGPAGSKDQSKVTVYRKAAASWYGPGFYGRPLACGGTMSPSRIGVANKTLPCGTKVRIHYRGRTVTAPVIDRGPYAGGRDYDLTAATKNRLHFGSTGTVWSSK
jgi:rare lipoprotein A (peptidoglycan hydrolase)